MKVNANYNSGKADGHGPCAPRPWIHAGQHRLFSYFAYQTRQEGDGGEQCQRDQAVANQAFAAAQGFAPCMAQPGIGKGAGQHEQHEQQLPVCTGAFHPGLQRGGFELVALRDGGRRSGEQDQADRMRMTFLFIVVSGRSSFAG